MNKTALALLLLPSLCLASECLCLGPTNTIANAPTRPVTCNGDYVFTASVLYWSAHQEGMESALNDSITVPVLNPTTTEITRLNNLRDAKYLPLRPKWDFGYRFGIGYNSPCDGWSLHLDWTHFQPFSTTEVEAGIDSNQTLICLWSGFAPAQGSITFERFLKAIWKLNLDWVTLDLGRVFWASKRLSLNPYTGLRFAQLKQSFYLEQMGGSWSPRINPDQLPLNGLVHMNNNFKGVGLISGIDCNWHIGCGFSIYGQGAGSIIYGAFTVNHTEKSRLGITPHSKNTILETKDRFRSSRGIFDFAFGVEYSARFYDSCYAVTGKLGWEEHLFFHQNQLWRVNRLGNIPGPMNNPTGENLFLQRKGTLDTSGLTFTLVFEF